MKIAIVTEDGRTISQHFGRAPHYEVLTVEDGEVTGRERRAKPAHGPGHHHGGGQGMISLQEESASAVSGAEAGDMHGAMAAPIRDCDTVVTRGMGRGAYDSLRSAGITPIVTVVSEIDEAVRQYLRGELTDHPERLHQPGQHKQ